MSLAIDEMCETRPELTLGAPRNYLTHVYRKPKHLVACIYAAQALLLGQGEFEVHPVPRRAIYRSLTSLHRIDRMSPQPLETHIPPDDTFCELEVISTTSGVREESVSPYSSRRCSSMELS